MLGKRFSLDGFEAGTWHGSDQTLEGRQLRLLQKPKDATGISGCSSFMHIFLIQTDSLVFFFTDKKLNVQRTQNNSFQ